MLSVPLAGDEEDLQGIPEVSGVEEEAQPEPEAVDVSGAEHAAKHQRVGAGSAASRLSGEHRRERPERGEDAPQRWWGDLGAEEWFLSGLLFVGLFDMINFIDRLIRPGPNYTWKWLRWFCFYLQLLCSVSNICLDVSDDSDGGGGHQTAWTHKNIF